MSSRHKPGWYFGPDFSSGAAGGLEGDSSSLPDKSEDPLEFELEALLSKRPTPLLVHGEVHHRIKRTLNVDQLDALTFAKCLEEFAAEIRSAAESYE